MFYEKMSGQSGWKLIYPVFFSFSKLFSLFSELVFFCLGVSPTFVS